MNIFIKYLQNRKIGGSFDNLYLKIHCHKQTYKLWG